MKVGVQNYTTRSNVLFCYEFLWKMGTGSCPQWQMQTCKQDKYLFSDTNTVLTTSLQLQIKAYVAAAIGFSGRK